MSTPTFFRHRIAVHESPLNGFTIQHVGDLTAAVRVNKPEDPKDKPTFDVAFVFCSVNDRFEKKVGRELSAERLAEGDFITVSQDDVNAHEGVVDAAREVIFTSEDDARPSFIPDRIWKRRQNVWFDPRKVFTGPSCFSLVTV